MFMLKMCYITLFSNTAISVAFPKLIPNLRITKLMVCEKHTE